MTPHPLILAELQKYRGGEFVPVWQDYRICWYDQAFKWSANGISGIHIWAADAHTRIELAAIKMLHRAGEVWMPKSLTPDALLASAKAINAKENA